VLSQLTIRRRSFGFETPRLYDFDTPENATVYRGESGLLT